MTRDIPTALGKASLLDSRSAAFSLIEVAIALGIISFVVISLVGLMSVGLQAEGYARADTIVASLSKDAISLLKMNNFSNLSDTNIYFDYDGEPVGSSTNAYFECRAVVTNSNLTFPGLTSLAFAKRIRLEFFWPTLAPTGYQSKQIFETTVANYD